MRALAGSSVVLPVVLVVVAIASIQSGAAVAKGLFPEIGSTGTAALRLLFGAILLSVVVRPWRARFGPGSWRYLVGYGLALAGMNTLFYAALRTLPLGVAVALELSGPLAVAAFSSRRLVDFLWVGLAGIGVVLLLPVGPDVAAVDPVGAAFALGAGGCWALYILFGKKAGAAHGVQSAAIGMIVGAVCVMPIALAQTGAATLLQPRLLPTAILVAILSTALPYALEMVALSKLATRTFGTLMSIEPAFAALSGFLFLHELLEPVHWVALAAIIAASAGTALTHEEAPPLVEPPAHPLSEHVERR